MIKDQYIYILHKKDEISIEDEFKHLIKNRKINKSNIADELLYIVKKRSSILELNMYTYEKEDELKDLIDYIKRNQKNGLKYIRFITSKNHTLETEIETIDLDIFKDTLDTHKNIIRLYRKTAKSFIPEIRNKLILLSNKVPKVDIFKVGNVIEQITILSYITISLKRTSDPENEFFGKIDTAVINIITKALLNYELKDDIVSKLADVKDYSLGFDIWNNINNKTMSYLANKKIH